MTARVQDEVVRAAAMLRESGARAVYVFGSAAEGAESPNDLDIAVEGLPPEKYIRTLGNLLCGVRMPVDLIDLDRDTPFVRRLRESGRLRLVA